MTHDLRHLIWINPIEPAHLQGHIKWFFSFLLFCFWSSLLSSSIFSESLISFAASYASYSVSRQILQTLGSSSGFSCSIILCWMSIWLWVPVCLLCLNLEVLIFEPLIGGFPISRADFAKTLLEAKPGYESPLSLMPGPSYLTLPLPSVIIVSFACKWSTAVGSRLN